MGTKTTRKIYRNHYSTEGGNSNGFSWHWTKTDARRAVRDEKENLEEQYEKPLKVAEEFEIDLADETNVILFLNQFCSHPDNG